MKKEKGFDVIHSVHKEEIEFLISSDNRSDYTLKLERFKDEDNEWCEWVITPVDVEWFTESDLKQINHVVGFVRRNVK